MSEITKIPRSIAIIMDGNGRWAQNRGLDRFEGHIQGVESVRMAIRSSVKWGVKVITLYAFSTENWGRPTAEVDALMELMAKCFVVEVPELKANGARIKIIGDRSRFSDKMQQMLAKAEAETRDETQLLVQVALSYSSRDEIRRGVTLIAERVAKGELVSSDITEEMISASLDTESVDDPDLIIRTSGEQRLSNFMMWQASYAELYFPEVLWPDFDEAEFEKALRVYQERDRRYGLVNECENNE